MIVKFINNIYSRLLSFKNSYHYTDLLYNIIYTFSKIQIFITKINKRLFPYICLFSRSVSSVLQKYNIITKQNIIYSIEFYKSNNLLIKKCISSEDLLKSFISAEKSLKEIKNTIPNEYNFIIYSDYSQLKDNKQINKICYENFPNNLQYELSNIRFISVLLNHESNEYLIELENDYYNYYIVNNKIDKNFVNYYWKHIIKQNTDISDYNLTLCDQDINIQILNPSDTIIIYKDSYEIVNEKNKKVD